MNSHLTLAGLMLLTLTLPGCVAAIPLAMQAMSSAGSSQFCSAPKVPGQAPTLCDRLSLNSAMQSLGLANAPATVPLKTATR